MKKTLYSLMLSDDVIREIDLLAHRKGTNRSNLVNQILAEHVKVRTPEQRVNDIFSEIEVLMSSSQIVPQFTSGAPCMAMRSCLEYKYRPTVRYEVELFKTAQNGAVGTISVIYRTQSNDLLERLTGFFGLWRKVEKQFLKSVDCSLGDGKFQRMIVPVTDESEISTSELAGVITDYVNLFDRLMKSYVAGNLTPEAMAGEYQKNLEGRSILI